MGIKEYTLYWFIENWSYSRYGIRGRLACPPFTDDGLEDTTWHLSFSPRGYYISGDYISLFLRRSDTNEGPESIMIRYELSVLAEDGSALSSQGGCQPLRKFEKEIEINLSMNKTLFQTNFPRDTLTVRCKMWTGEGRIQNIAPVCARTRVRVETISYVQVVEHFSLLESNQKSTVLIRSRLKNRGFASSSLYFTDGEMMLDITPLDNHHVLLKRKISLLGSKNVTVCGEEDTRFSYPPKDICAVPLSLSRQAILNEKGDYLPDNKLSLLCQCSFYIRIEHERLDKTRFEMPVVDSGGRNGPEFSMNVSNALRKASAYPSGLEDMKTLYFEQTLTDVELKTKTKSFQAHKLVLCARSPVLKHMLSSFTRKKSASCIQVEDLDDDVMEHLLLFLYSDTVPDIQWTLAIRLYNAADKYEVGRLKAACSNFLVENLDPSNAGELLLLTDVCSDNDLKKVVHEFIMEHAEQVFGSEEWEKLMKTNPLLAMETMHLKFKRKKMN